MTRRKRRRRIAGVLNRDERRRLERHLLEWLPQTARISPPQLPIAARRLADLIDGSTWLRQHDQIVTGHRLPTRAEQD